MHVDFRGKKVLITGASGTIGTSCAKKFYALGADLVLSSTNQDHLEELCQILRNQYTKYDSQSCIAKACDLSQLESISQLFDEIDSLDILISNAGITEDQLCIRMSTDSFQKIIDVNLTASFILNREALKIILKNKSRQYGRIINISSVVGLTGNKGQANYCASKAGIIGMTKAIAQEFGQKNITVNAVLPGFIQSNMTEKLSEDQKTKILDRIPMNKMGTADEVSNAIIFLASEYASYITGTSLHVNGGLYM